MYSILITDLYLIYIHYKYYFIYQFKTYKIEQKFLKAIENYFFIKKIYFNNYLMVSRW